jgi:hypothetical protein
MFIDISTMDRYLELAAIAPSARKHGISDEDMIHALRHHLFPMATEDPEVIIYVGPSRTAEPLEIGVLDDDDGLAVIHAMPARQKFLKGVWN